MYFATTLSMPFKQLYYCIQEKDIENLFKAKREQIGIKTRYDMAVSF